MVSLARRSLGEGGWRPTCPPKPRRRRVIGTVVQKFLECGDSRREVPPAKLDHAPDVAACFEETHQRDGDQDRASRGVDDSHKAIGLPRMLHRIGDDGDQLRRRLAGVLLEAFFQERFKFRSDVLPLVSRKIGLMALM